MAPFLLPWLLLFSIIFTTVLSSSPEAPWQQSSGPNVLDEAIFGNQPVTVFAPGGRLYFLERTVAAASSVEDPSSNLVVALSCREGIVVVTTSCTSPHLDISSDGGDDDKEKDDSDSTTTPLWITTSPTKDEGHYHRAPLSRLSSNTWMVTGGNAVDSTMLRLKISRISESLQIQNDGGQPLPSTPISCAALARRVANHLQQSTQSIGKAGRILASYALLAGRDKQNTCSLWRVDPTGQFWKCNAATIGRGATAAEAHLQELVSTAQKDSTSDLSLFFSNLSSRQAISMACACLEKALPKDEKLYWQALVLRSGETSQVLDGSEIQSLLLQSSDSDNQDDKIQ